MTTAAPTDKSDLAFRTISEAAEVVGVPQHVLRFWETRFPQLQPLKRGGNRRYYRPADMALLETIRSMLHDQGLTIRGAKLVLGGGVEPARNVTPTAPRSPGRRATDRQPVPAENPAAPAPRFLFAPTAVAPADGNGSPTTIEIERGRLISIRDRLRIALAA